MIGWLASTAAVPAVASDSKVQWALQMTPVQSEAEVQSQSEAEEGSGAKGTQPPASGHAPSQEEREAVKLERAQEVLNRIDDILQEAQSEAQRQSDQTAADASSGGGAAMDGLDGDEPADSDEGTGDDGERLTEEAAEAGAQTASEEQSEAGQAEGQVGGNQDTGKSAEDHDYEPDTDIVTRQVCDLARREPDPDQKREMQKQCEILRNN